MSKVHSMVLALPLAAMEPNKTTGSCTATCSCGAKYNNWSLHCHLQLWIQLPRSLHCHLQPWSQVQNMSLHCHLQPCKQTKHQVLALLTHCGAWHNKNIRSDRKSVV